MKYKSDYGAINSWVVDATKGKGTYKKPVQKRDSVRYQGQLIERKLLPTDYNPEWLEEINKN